MQTKQGTAMNHTANFPSASRTARPLQASFLTDLAGALRDTAAFLLAREAYASFAAPRALRYPPGKRARRFMRGGE
jgi:hypothetical protein